MATPIGHTLVAGLVLFGRRRRQDLDLRLLAYYAFVANAPDLDILVDIFAGGRTGFHHGPTHSLPVAVVFAPLAGIAFKGVFKWFANVGYLRLMAIGLLMYASHLALDFVTLDNGVPYGMPLLWPFSNIYVSGPVFVIPNVLHGSGFLNVHNFKLVMREAIVFGPPLLFLALANKGILGRFKKVGILLIAVQLVSVAALFARTNPFR